MHDHLVALDRERPHQISQLAKLERPVEQGEFLIKASSIAAEVGQRSQAIGFLQQALILAEASQILPLVQQAQTLLTQLEVSV